MAATTELVGSSEGALTRPQCFNFATDVVDRWASANPSLEAMFWVSQDLSQRRSLSFQHFSRQSNRIAILLQSLGVRPGEVMLVVVPRLPAWWEIAVAGLRSGVVVSPGPTQLSAKDLQYRSGKSKATVFVGDTVSTKKFLSVKSQCPTVKLVLNVEHSPVDGVTSLYEVLENISPAATFSMRPSPWSAPAMIYFTSGTSGPPKMVLHNQVSIPLASIITARYWHGLEPGTLFWNTADQGWAKAAWSFFGAWNLGASLFVCDDRGSFSAERHLNILHDFPITTICAPPLAWRQFAGPRLRQHLVKNPPLALRHCTSAGEALNDEVIRTWKKISGLDIYEGYGQTETILLCNNSSRYPIRPGSMGKPAPTVPLFVIDAEGRECRPDQEGNIALKIPQDPGPDSFFGIFDGYMNDDGSIKRPQQTFRRDGAEETWFLTGDKARRDEDGYFWFVGRSDDVINTSGYRIGPFEVESTLHLHPAVAESAVISSPDPVRGEVVKAFVVLSQLGQAMDQEALRKELQDFCKANAAPYKYPRKIEFVAANSLPRTVSGKIQRSVLRKVEWNKTNAKL